jgi:hypothetical protein
LDKTVLFNFSLALFNPFDILLAIFNFGILLPEYLRVFLNLLNCLVRYLCGNIIKIIASELLIKANKDKELLLAPVSEALREQLILLCLILLCELGRLDIFIVFEIFFRVSLIKIPLSFFLF